MPLSAPSPITALPTPPSTSSPSTFAAQGDAFLAALPLHTTETNTVSAVNYNNAVDAAASAASASANASLAFAAAGAALWVSGTSYALGAAVISPSSLLVYRRKVAGAGTTDPASDATNWKVNSMEPQWVTKNSAYTAVAGDSLRVDTSGAVVVITLPASPLDNDSVRWKDYAGTFGTNKLTFARNGKNIMGLAQDMDVSTSNLNGVLGFIAATNDWRF